MKLKSLENIDVFFCFSTYTVYVPLVKNLLSQFFSGAIMATLATMRSLPLRKRASDLSLRFIQLNIIHRVSATAYHWGMYVVYKYPAYVETHRE